MSFGAHMNAGPQSIVSLLTSANQRMVTPAHQRAYSWDEEQCRQLCNLAVARAACLPV